MKRFILFPICFVALAVPVVVLASGAHGGFDGVVSSSNRAITCMRSAFLFWASSASFHIKRRMAA